MKKILLIFLTVFIFFQVKAQYPSRVFTPVQFEDLKLGKRIFPPADTFPVILKDTGAWVIKDSVNYKVFNVDGVARWKKISDGAGVDTLHFTNVGGGIQVLKDATGTTLVNRTFVDGTNSTARLVDSNSITFDYTGGIDTLHFTHVGGGIQLLKDAAGTTFINRTFVNGTNSTARLVDSTGITFDFDGTGDVSAAGDNNFTGLNNFNNSGTQTISRSTEGEILTMNGPSGNGNIITLGTDEAFGYNKIVSNKRLDLIAEGSTYIVADFVHFGGGAIVDRLGTASSVETQSGSNDLVLETSLWPSGSHQYNYSGFKTVPSLSVAGQYDMGWYVNSPTNPDLFSALPAITIRNTDRSIRLPAFANGGDDSIMGIDADGLLKKLPVNLGSGDVYTDAANTIVDAGTQTIQRTTDGVALSVNGPTAGGNMLTFGTNTSFGFNEMLSNRRLDISALGNDIFFSAERMHLSNATILDRVSTATSVEDQSGSKPLTFESSTWVDGEQVYNYSGLKVMPSYSVEGQYDLGIYVDAPNNPDIFVGVPVMTFRSTDKAVRLPQMSNGGPDSTSVIAGDGKIKKGVAAYGTSLYVHLSSSGNFSFPDSVQSLSIMSAIDTVFLPDPTINSNRIISISNGDASAVPIYTSGSAINANNGFVYWVGYPSMVSLASHKSVTLQSNGVKWYYISGGL